MFRVYLSHGHTFILVLTTNDESCQAAKVWQLPSGHSQRSSRGGHGTHVIRGSTISVCDHSIELTPWGVRFVGQLPTRGAFHLI